MTSGAETATPTNRATTPRLKTLLETGAPLEVHGMDRD